MTLIYLAHAAFLIVTSSGQAVVTDPYEYRGFGGALEYDRIVEKADIALVSHDHRDHNAVGDLPGEPTVIRGSGEHRASGLIFTGVESDHDPEGGKQRGKNTIFVFEADSIRVCHLGDLGQPKLRPEQVEALGRVDVLLIPVGGTYTIGPEEATAVVEQLTPRIVIPMHFKTDKTSLPIGPVDDFLKGVKRVERPNGSRLTVTQGSLPEAMTIVVLEPSK